MRRIPILNYHAVTDDPSAAIGAFAVRPAMFARHLDVIVRRGGTAMTVADLAECRRRGADPPPGAVVVTFDDGYEDNLSVAVPLLQARGLRSTVFVVTGFLPGCPAGTVRQPFGPMIAWSRLGELEAAGMEIGSHTHTHPQLDVVPRASASREIRLSKSLLEQALGHAVESFAYPHGYASGWVQQEVRLAGYASACGVRNAFSHAGDNPWLLARLVMGPATTPEQIDKLVSGAGRHVAPGHELFRTKAWRALRRSRAGTVLGHATPA